MILRPWSAVRLAVLALACALLPSSAHASLTGLGEVTSPIPELSTALPRELPGPCTGELCGELEAPQPKTRVRGFELDLYCRLGGEGGLSCRPRRVWAEEYGEGTSDQSLFTGHYFDTETQLYYAKARYFDPELGRFLSQDSYLGELTEPPSLHRYLYAHDRPTFYVDPDGHDVDLAERARQEAARRAALKERGPSFTNDQGGQVVSADGPAVVPDRGPTGGAMSEDELRLDPELRSRFAKAKAKAGMPTPNGQVTEESAGSGDPRMADVLEGKARTFEALHTFGEYGKKTLQTAWDLLPGSRGLEIAAGEDVRGYEVKRAGAGGELIIVIVAGKALYRIGSEVVGLARAARSSGRSMAELRREAAALEREAVAAQRTARRAPAPDNYRGRYNAARAAEGKARLPEELDAHHRIPRAFEDHPEFGEFDFHEPSNIRGVRGSRADVNVHQDVTNEWEAFREANPNASREQVEEFAKQIDKKYGGDWFK